MPHEKRGPGREIAALERRKAFAAEKAAGRPVAPGGAPAPSSSCANGASPKRAGTEGQQEYPDAQKRAGAETIEAARISACGARVSGS
jgi:hypothetical protein